MSTQENAITLTIISGSGDIEDEFPPDMTVGELKQLAMDRLNTDPAASEAYQLVADGEPLPADKRLEDVELPDESAVIDLEPEPEVI
jgi:hypothetical protein